VLGGRTAEVIHECRNCGTAVETSEPTCGACGSSNVARYEIE
jgi:RNA polymerase subunit RPABC4/transcription elongation factor Spt4